MGRMDDAKNVRVANKGSAFCPIVECWDEQRLMTKAKTKKQTGEDNQKVGS